MTNEALIAELESAETFFNRSSSCLTEDDSTFAPQPELLTVSQQVAHVAQTVEWFFQGAFRPEGFDMNFERMMGEIFAVTSLAEARAWLARAFESARATLASKSAAELTEKLPDGPILAGKPRLAIVGSIVDHTAHHRGALTVYSRLRGHVPEMPYM